MQTLSSLRSIWVWCSVVVLVLLWLPLLTVIRVFEHDPVRYRTGLWFRKLGRAISRVNPAWDVHLEGEKVPDPHRPYVVVSNHQSLADIPIIANLPWEMKWVAKIELFKIPVVGWMMRLAGDIPIDRGSPQSGTRMLLTALRYLQNNCSIMFFPEGTRSLDGRVGRFHDGAFHIAIRAKVPVLPIVVEGSRECIPKHTWKFGKGARVRLKVLPAVNTAAMNENDEPGLKDTVRGMIISQLAEWRGVRPAEVDILTSLSTT
jgi:1-acyl-sn-glycerol-3-phosphate acyltransferase